MLPMLILGTIIERQIGSILFFLVLITCWVISVILEVSMATMLYHVFHNLFHGCSLGLSGVVFGLLVIMSKVTGLKDCGIGIVKIPFSVVPWLCVVIYYFGFHRGSVFLHIGGIIAGYACILYDIFEVSLNAFPLNPNYPHIVELVINLLKSISRVGFQWSGCNQGVWENVPTPPENFEIEALSFDGNCNISFALKSSLSFRQLIKHKKNFC